MKILIITIWYILLVTTSPAAGQPIRPTTIQPNRIEPGIPKHQQPVDTHHQVDADAPAITTPDPYKENLEIWERHERHMCDYWTRRYGFDKFHSDLIVDCDLNLEGKPKPRKESQQPK